MKKKILITFLLLMTTIGFTLSQNTSNNVQVQIKGQLLDSTSNETVPYATIKILDKTDQKNVLKVVASDDNGRFTIVANQEGSYLLSAEYIGKNTLIISIEVKEKSNIDLGKLNMSDNTQMLSEVVIEAQRPLVQVDLDKIVYSMEADPEAKTNNVLDMLKKVPLITVDGEDQIQLKGSSNYKIYMNGKPSTMIANNPKDVLKSMPANSIKNIEVITDPGAKYDAEGVEGIINIITHSNSSMGGYTVRLNSFGNSFGTIGGGVNLTLKYGKIGFTGNFNIYDFNMKRLPRGSTRDEWSKGRHEYLTTEGSTEYKGNGQWGSGELSYEIDTLNLINVSFNRYGGKERGYSDFSSLTQDADDAIIRHYENNQINRYVYGNTTVGVDYQRTFKNAKDRLLTISYRLDISPNDSGSENDEIGYFNYPTQKRKEYSDGDTKEHTGQIDFTTPIAKIHTIETGVKYIKRLSQSLNEKNQFDIINQVWHQYEKEKFEYDQNIFAGYLGYNLKVAKWGFKAGLRYEYTSQEAKYPLDNPSKNRDFETNYSNVVPSTTLTYQLKPSQTIRLGYNMSIRRPGLWQLNPYVNTSDSLNISMGNPNLDAVNAHSMNLNYSFFNPKININANVSYRMVNNNVEEFSTMKEGIRYTSYDNIGRNRDLNTSLYINWSPTSKLRLNGNLGGSYYSIKANNELQYKKNGFRPELNGGVQYDFPWELKFNTNGGYFGGWIGLQTQSTYFYYYSFSLSKSFLKDKLTVRVNTFNPFEKEHKMVFKSNGENYAGENFRTRQMRAFGFNISYQFGELKQQIKKAQRSIQNDDSMGGGQGSQGGGGQ